MNKKVSIAVLSDLHCHAQNELPNGTTESYLIAGSPGVPTQNHPIQALIKLIKEKGLKADVIVVCGDLANRASRAGMSYVWDQLRADLQPNLQASIICWTIGNHDVASRELEGDPFEKAKHIHQDFPFGCETDNNRYWTDGFCLKRLVGLADFLIINTAHDHYNEVKARSGSFNQDKLKKLDEYLTNECSSPFKVAVFHHHPIIYSSPIPEANSVLPSGQDLIDVLAKHDFKFIIHGHRHQPHISRIVAFGRNIFILCAGSFSARLDAIGTITRNLFHMVNLEIDDNQEISGALQSWEYHFGEGWEATSKKSGRIHHIVNLGPPPDSTSAQLIADLFEKEPTLRLLQDPELIRVSPTIKYMLPDEIDKLTNELRTKSNLELKLDENGIPSRIWKSFEEIHG